MRRGKGGRGGSGGKEDGRQDLTLGLIMHERHLHDGEQ